VRPRDLTIWAALVALGTAMSWIILRTNPFGILGPCPLRLLTGVPCPSCGGTQAVAALFRLDLLEALRSNPLLTLFALTFVASGVASLSLLPWAGRLRGRVRSPARVLAWVVLGLVLANWVYLVLSVR
jgi:hypothetical protein